MVRSGKTRKDQNRKRRGRLVRTNDSDKRINERAEEKALRLSERRRTRKTNDSLRSM